MNEADLLASECRYICNEDSKTDLYQYIHRYTTIHLGLQDMTKSGKVGWFGAAYTNIIVLVCTGKNTSSV